MRHEPDTAAHQRHHVGLDLRADRHRLHHGVRHYRHGQFRPWRRVHGGRLCRAGRLSDPHHLVRGLLDRGRAVHRADRRHVVHLAGQLDH